jgi:starch-binding outer membrane protein, SusD/RagB family
MRQIGPRAARSRPRLLHGAVFMVLLGAVTGCDSLLDVSIPGRVQDAELNSPLLANTMVTSALGEFECALSQYVVSTGILTGEYIVSGFSIGSNNWGWRGDVELRAQPGSCGTGYGYYTPLQVARFLAEDAGRRIESFPDDAVPGKTGLLAQLAVYAGYAYTLLGEGFCEMAIDNGPLMTRAQVFTKAEEKFSRALTLAGTADAVIRNMALVGRARVRLNLGRGAEAATDAEQVPAGYVRNAGYSTVIPRRENRVYNATVIARDLSVAVAYRNLQVGTVADVRVPVEYTGRIGNDGFTPQWDQLKYSSRSAPIPIASYDEAQLIIAEARGGQEALDAINRLRTRASLPLLAPGTVVDLSLVLEERRRELFSEGHRYNDMLRHGIPFPTGVNHKGQSYGSITCMPLPDVERQNNPNL